MWLYDFLQISLQVLDTAQTRYLNLEDNAFPNCCSLSVWSFEVVLRSRTEAQIPSSRPGTCFVTLSTSEHWSWLPSELVEVPCQIRHQESEWCIKRRIAVRLAQAIRWTACVDTWQLRTQTRLCVSALSVEERVEIDHALKYFKGDLATPLTIERSRSWRSTALNQSPENTNHNTFPLPALSIKLAKVRDQIYNGVGVAVIRGLNLDAYTEEEIATIFLGTSSYIAERRGKQDHRGSMLSE